MILKLFSYVISTMFGAFIGVSFIALCAANKNNNDDESYYTGYNKDKNIQEEI